MAISTPELSVVSDVNPGRSHRLLADLDLLVPAIMLVLILFGCFAAPALLHIASPNAGSITDAFRRIGAPGHVLGTNPLGNDELSQCLFGGRTSLEVGLGSVSIGLVVGAFLGVVSGYFGGILETIVMRVLDTLLAFPTLILALVVATYLGASEVHVMFAIAYFTVPSNARIARAATLKIRSRDFIVASRFAGRTNRSILIEHVLPSAVQPLITFGLLSVGVAIIVEATLSFLGLGIPPPQPSWGDMISAGQTYLSTDPELVLTPAIFLFLTVLSLNLLGDALRARWAEL